MALGHSARPASESNAPEVKPKLRGVTHVWAALAAALAGAWLATAAPTRSGALSSLAFTGSLVVQFTVSGLYHTLTWPPTQRRLLRQADHAAIFVLIAGTYTPVCLLALHGALGTKLLILVWTGAGLGILQSLFWVSLPKLVTACLYLALGWLAAQYRVEIVARTGMPWALQIVGGGVLYSVGAFAYMLKWPNPVPKVFGYHEVFHVFVILAAATHFVAMTQLILGMGHGEQIH